MPNGPMDQKYLEENIATLTYIKVKNDSYKVSIYELWGFVRTVTATLKALCC